jgi:hypothetical protein
MQKSFYASSVEYFALTKGSNIVSKMSQNVMELYEGISLLKNPLEINNFLKPKKIIRIFVKFLKYFFFNLQNNNK